MACSVARPSRNKRAPPWFTSVGDDGGIFHLELPGGVEAKLVRLNSGDGGSVSSLALGTGCNSEDTGYSSDQELSPTDHHCSVANKPAKGRKAAWYELEATCYSFSKNDSKELKNLSASFSISTSHTSSSTGHTSNSAIYEREKTFDVISSLKLKSCSDLKVTVKPQVDINILASLDEEDAGVCLNKFDVRSSKTSNDSTHTTKSGCSLKSSGTCNGPSDTSPCKTNLSNDHRHKGTNSARSSFTRRVKCEWKTTTVEINLDSSKNVISQARQCPLHGAALCEHILGIIPTHKEECDMMGRSQSPEIIVKGIIPGSPASQRREITAGSWLHSVNGEEITWHNMDMLLSTLNKLPKVKLTLKSFRPEKSPVDLETLVNILTSNVQDHHSLDNVAAMYISLESVDPDDPDNDGLVYSFPSEHNALHQLQGMFYTLAHLVKDIYKTRTIRNTTISIDSQRFHVAYLQEGSDVLVFALPAACASVHQLNTLLSEFSRLLCLLFGSVETAFAKGQHSVFIDNTLTYLFRQVLSTTASLSSLSSTLSSAAGLKGRSVTFSEAFPFVRYCQSVPALSLPDELMMVVGKTLSEFESSDFADMSESFYGCRRQYTILGSAFFYCGHLVCSHMAPKDLRDLQLYLQHMGVLDLMARCSVAQFVAWREVYPTRFCHDVAEINNSFGYSEPNARWCFLVVGLKHGLFCCLLETIGPINSHQHLLSPDMFYVDQAKACLLQLQTPQLIAALNIRVSKESQSAFAKSDYCATYVNTTGEKSARLFSDGRKLKTSRSAAQLMTASHKNWTGSSIGLDASGNSENLYKSPRCGKMYPLDTEGKMMESLTLNTPLGLSSLPALHRLSPNHRPSIYQYCCLDGLEGTVIVESDMDNSGIFHHHIVHNFYLCCRQIHHFFRNHADKQPDESFHGEEGDNYEQIVSDPHLRGMKEHGILMTFNPHQGDDGHKSWQPLEYWVVGRRIKRPYVKEMYTCFCASTPQSVVELAFRTRAVG